MGGLTAGVDKEFFVRDRDRVRASAIWIQDQRARGVEGLSPMFYFCSPA